MQSDDAGQMRDYTCVRVRGESAMRVWFTFGVGVVPVPCGGRMPPMEN